MQYTNRQWLLNERPRGFIDESTFRRHEYTVPNLNEGEALVKVLYLSFDPAQRGWMDDVPSYMPPVPLGEPMRASGVGQVVASRNPDYSEGSLVTGLLNWQEYAHYTSDSAKVLRPVARDTPPTHPLSLFGGTSMTAYFGLLQTGQPQAGETVIVSGAAGATGSIVCQVARLKGCRVIGIAGGPEKCNWLRHDVGVDHVIDYQSESLDQRLGDLCPDGANVFFDNVGGSTLETVMDHMAFYSRLVLCGAIAGYNDAEASPGPRNMFRIISHRLRLQGFIVSDFLHLLPEFTQEFGGWVKEGKITWREDIQEGFENIPATLQRLFEGKNQGKQLLKLADPF